jgi:hypothetical protein
MKYNNRNFPHPVLGVSDDVNAEFSAELTYKSDRENITLTPTFKLTDDSILTLIGNGTAYFLTQIYCSGTMFREVFKAKSPLAESIQIPSYKLKGDVEVHFFVCAANSIVNFFSKNFNPEYLKSKFILDPCDILAYGGKAKFVANKTPEELRSISSLIRIKNSQKSDHPMWNEYEGEKIEIVLCDEDYNNYQMVLKNRVFNTLLHSSIVLPALVDALYFIDTPEAKDLIDKRWFKALKDQKTRSKTPDCFKIAQNILEQPNERTFGTLLTLMEETNIES